MCKMTENYMARIEGMGDTVQTTRMGFLQIKKYIYSAWNERRSEQD